MAEEYSKYKLFRKYKTEDGVNYTPLDEYQALYESGDGVDCSCGYRKYKWDSGNDTKSTILNSDTDRTIPMQTFRIDATYPNNSGNYFIRFTTTPDTDTTSNKGFSICPDEGTIWDNGERKYITAQTNIYDNVYEYTFSVPVYFSNGEENAPYEQVTAVTYNCEYICGGMLNEDVPTLTINRVQGNWARDGYRFTSNQITHNENTIERIYFSVSEPTKITFTIDQSSDNNYDYLIISKLDSGVTDSTSTGYSSPNYAHWKGKTTGSTSMTINDTEEHFVELMYRTYLSDISGRDNVIVTLGVNVEYDVTSEYEVWREYDYCPNDDTIETLPTGNVEYRYPQKSCGCGYREYDIVNDGTWICNRYIEETDNEQYYGKENTEPNLIITKHKNIIGPYVFLYDKREMFKINAYSSYFDGLIRIYFKLNKSGVLKINSSGYRNGCFYELSYLDKPLSEGAMERSDVMSDKYDVINEYTVEDTEEHYFEMRYYNDWNYSVDSVFILTLSYEDDFQKYEVWEEKEYCPDNDEYDVYTGNFQYRNPTQCCECGYREYDWEWDKDWEDAYICGSLINEDIMTITKVEGDWTKDGNTFTSNSSELQRIYFNLKEPSIITFTVDLSYGSLLIGKLNQPASFDTSSASGVYLHKFTDNNKGSTSMTVYNTDECYIDFLCDYPQDNNIIVTISVDAGYDILSEYEVWKEYEYCPDSDGYKSYTGYVEYRNPQKSCKCGYREYKWMFSGDEYVCGCDWEVSDPTLITISSNTDRTIPMQRFRIDATDPQNTGYYFIRFTTTPDTDTTDNHSFSICPDEGTIWDNGMEKSITAQTKIDDNVYEYTFSVPVYFSNAEKNAPVSQVTAVINDGLKPYYKYEVWRQYVYCPNDDTIETLPTGNIEYRNPILVGQNWVMTTQSKLGSELGEGYEQDKRYVLYESYSLCNGKLIETEWRESNLVFKTEIEEKYIKYEANETFIPMGSTVGDIIAHIPVSKYCCESTITGCKQYCYNLYSISTIDKDGNRTQIYSGRMNGTQVTLRDNENYSYSLSFGDYCGNSGRDAYFTYTLKDEDYHYYMCAVEYQKYDYEDDTKWVEIGYTPRYPSNK